VRRFLKSQGREADWAELVADPDADYDIDEEIDLTRLEPLIAHPSSPGNVVPVRGIAGRPIYQAYVGSSANPGYRDFAVVAEIVKGRRVHDRVSFDVNPTSRQILENLVRDGHLLNLIHAGARIHQTGCNGCIGMGQAPATEKISLRTVPRNFPGRSGTREDKVYLVSPETAAASALTGVITDPRDLDMPYPHIADTDEPILNRQMLVAPLQVEEARKSKLEKGPNIASLPEFEALPNELQLTVLLKVGDNISTDEIMPAGARVLPFRSNIPKIAEFAFDIVDRTYWQRAKALEGTDGHAVVGGSNYGQGSSREHAALAPRYLGLRVVLAKGFARIHGQNLVNFGILPLEFVDPAEYDELANGDILVLKDLREKLPHGRILIENRTRSRTFESRHDLSPRQVQVVLVGGLINWVKQRL
jgi:aconitate hydratase